MLRMKDEDGRFRIATETFCRTPSRNPCAKVHDTDPAQQVVYQYMFCLCPGSVRGKRIFRSNL